MATTTKAKAPKASATISNVIVDAYKNLINLEGEQAFIELCVKRLSAGTSSVRDIQASIKSANGSAPTLRASHVQYFATMSEIMATVKGAKNQPISELLKMAQRFQTAHSKENVESELAKVENYEQLAKETPTLETTRNRKNAKATPAPASLENIFIKTISDINAYKGQGSIQSLKTTDLQTLATLAELIRVIAQNSGLKPKAKA